MAMSGHVHNPTDGSAVSVPTESYTAPHFHDETTDDAVYAYGQSELRRNHRHGENGIVWEVEPAPLWTELVEGERIAGGLLSDRQVALACATLRQVNKPGSVEYVLDDAEAFLAFLRADDNPTEA